MLFPSHFGNLVFGCFWRWSSKNTMYLIACLFFISSCLPSLSNGKHTTENHATKVTKNQKRSLSSYILRRPQNFAKSSPNFWLQYIQSKVRWRFRKILWPSQNIMNFTLTCNELGINLALKRIWKLIRLLHDKIDNVCRFSVLFKMSFLEWCFVIKRILLYLKVTLVILWQKCDLTILKKKHKLNQTISRENLHRV